MCKRVNKVKGELIFSKPGIIRTYQFNVYIHNRCNYTSALFAGRGGGGGGGGHQVSDDCRG